MDWYDFSATMIDDSDMQPGWQLSQTDSTAVVGDITTSAFTDLPTSTLDFESLSHNIGA